MSIGKSLLVSSAALIGKRAVRKTISMAGVEPAYVKALVRKPPVIHGGPKVRRFPWPRRRHFGQEEKKAAIEVLDREIREGGALIYGGPEENAYCESFCRYLGGGYADAVNSGTNAIYVALRSLDLEPHTEVIVPPITDPGGAMPVALMNCIPVPADSAPGSLNCSAEQIEEVLTPRTGAIMVAHIGGYPIDMDPILSLARARSIPVLEDCAQAHGAVYKGRPIGSLGDVSAFSTMFGKHHSTGAQGGVVFTKDRRIFARIKQIADRGKPFGVLGTPENLVASLNFNQDELSMAIGRVQLAKLPGAIKIRRDFVNIVADCMKNVHGVDIVGDPAESQSSYWFLLVRLDESRIRCSPAEFAQALELEGIGGVSAGYSFFPTDHPWFQFGVRRIDTACASKFELVNARAASRSFIRIDVHESLGAREGKDLAKALAKLAQYFSA
jgi:perosamine synthetase